MPKKTDFFATGRRKTSVARVRFKKGKGSININGRDISEYFGRKTSRMVVTQPLELTDTVGDYNVNVNVFGGGKSGQAGAIRLGISRILQHMSSDYKTILRHAGMLTRDSREVERKKYGRPGARKQFQFSKR